MCENTSIKWVKHIRDNICGYVVHAMTTRVTQLATCAKHEENGETANYAFEGMVTKIMFGHNPASLPDTKGLMLGNERGHTFRNFASKIVDCGARMHSTLKHCQ